MESLSDFVNSINNISEAFTLGDDNFKSKNERSKYFPKDNQELRKLLEERLAEDKDADLNDIDVSQITNMDRLFYKLDPHNIDISLWDVSNVENMNSVFYGCKKFNCDLNSWNVSKVTNMEHMFHDCNVFNCDLSNWNVSKVKNMESMFYHCYEFEGKGLENWKIDSLINFRYMFDGCINFCANLKKWKVTHKMSFNKDLFKNSPKMKNKAPLWIYMYG